MTSLEAPSVETFREVAGTSPEFLLRANPSHSAVLSVAGGTVRLVKNLDGVRVASVNISYS